MIERRELITISRQIGSMMEAGVDILRVTRVLRAQTEDEEILRAFDTLDHGLRMGIGMADAMEKVPAIFSPFAVSLVRQGEARNDIPGAFHKIADFLQKEDEADVRHESGAVSTPAAPAPATLNAPVLPAGAMDDFLYRAQIIALRFVVLAAGLLLTLAAVWGSVEAGIIERRWQNVALYGVAALYIVGGGMWLRRLVETEHHQQVEQRETMQIEAAQNAAQMSTPVPAPKNQSGVIPPVTEKNNSSQEATFE